MDATKVSCLLSSCYFQKLKKKHLQLSGEVRCTSFQTFKPPKKETKYNLRVNISLYNTQHQPLSLVKELDSNLKSLLIAVWVNLHYNAWKTTVESIWSWKIRKYPLSSLMLINISLSGNVAHFAGWSEDFVEVKCILANANVSAIFYPGLVFIFSFNFLNALQRNNSSNTGYVLGL